MKFSQQVQSQIESIIRQALSGYSEKNCQAIISDIHLQANAASGELIIFDDDDEELAAGIIEEWLSYAGSDFYKDAERVLRSILSRIKDAGELDCLSLLQPYSFVLVDEDKETISELLLVDEDILLVNDELLEGLDKELDDFLKNLLEDKK